MRNRLSVIIPAIILVFPFLVSSCNTASAPAVKFKMFTPYAALSASEITAIGADGFSGTDEAVANAILNWQNNNMKLVDPSIKSDASYPMRWNNIMPGIYPVSDMVTARTMDDAGVQKIYGVCWDFASIFCSIAGYYGLEARVTAWKIYMSGVPGGEKGLSPDEYNTLLPKLTAGGVSFSYDKINSIIKETYIHYRAEVKINGTWRSYDGTGPTGEYANDANYSASSWDEGYSSELAE